ncbi:MAG: putative multitransrane protein [Oscillospiraceae bacterium]|nr:putative multitransrane protein [Oscillospiraceae bacterium]
MKSKFQEFDLERFFKRVIPIILILSILSLLIYSVNRVPIKKIGIRSGVYYEKAVVTQVTDEKLVKEQTSGSLTGTQKVKLKITSGNLKGKIFETTNYASYTYNVVCKTGTKLIVSVSVSGDQQMASIYTYDRSGPLFVIIGLFCLVLCAIGGKKGFKSLISLSFTLICIFFLFIPLLSRGASPVLASILLAVAATFVTMILIDGWNAKTVSAIIGTILCVTVAGILCSLVSYFTNISGFTLSDTEELIMLTQQNGLQLKGLMFASILIASLGAIMDVCISISSSVNEVYQNSPGLSKRELFRSGVNVGRDTMGTMSNTLILAFTGGSLTTILLLYSYDVSFHELFSTPSIAIEIIQGMTGSLGIFTAVPIVAFISSQLMSFKGKLHPGQLFKQPAINSNDE